MLIYLIEAVNSLHLFIWQVTAVCFTFWRASGLVFGADSLMEKAHAWGAARSAPPSGQVEAGASGERIKALTSRLLCVYVCVCLCKGQTEVWPVFNVVAFVGFKNLNFCSPAARTRRFGSNCSSCCTRLARRP